jgi:hypothetical protein
MEEIMSPAFGRYVNGIDIIAPKPTTFNVSLINGQEFSIKYLGNKLFSVKVAGKKYNPINLGEAERCSQAIADLLELNYAPAEGKEQPGAAPEAGAPPSEPTPAEPTGPGAAELGPELAAAETTPPSEEETPPAEA